jgi:hypothetical protein
MRVVPNLPRALASAATIYRARFAAAGVLGGAAGGAAGAGSAGSAGADASVLYDGVERGREDYSLENTLRAYQEAAALLQ